MIFDFLLLTPCRQLKPDSHRKFKTCIKWRNLNPVFNEEFFFEKLRPNELHDKQSLIITVWDKVDLCNI